MMKPKNLLLLALSFTTVSVWAQGNFGDLPKTVDAKDVEIMSVSEIQFSSRDSIVVDPITGRIDTLIIDEGITSVKPIEDAVGPALAPRRAPSTSDKDQYGGLTYAGKQLARSGAYLYTYKYPSVDADGNKVVLSAMMGVPRRQFQVGFAHPNNVLIACHETITSNWECPTNYNNGGSWQTGVGMMLMYTRYDRIRQPCCLVFMPDYEGYGITANRAHPYLYQELTARQVVDAVRYGLAFYNANVGSGEEFRSLENDWQSVSLGYSQGGSVALAVHKFIEQNGLDTALRYAGSVCGDGPYDPVGHLLYYINDNGRSYHVKDKEEKKTAHTPGTVSMPIVMPLILKGMCDSNPLMRQHSIEEYLSSKFLSTGSMQMIEAKSNSKKEDQFSTTDVTKRYIKQRKEGMSNFVIINNPYLGTVSYRIPYTAEAVCEMFYYASDPLLFGSPACYGKLQQMLTNECYTYFTTSSNFQDAQGNRVTPTARGIMQDLHRALESNNLTVGWTPKHRVAFYHSTYDTVVPFANLCSFVKNQPNLDYYVTDLYRLYYANATPSTIVADEKKADVYIEITNSTEDHVGAGKDFFFLGNVFGTSPDYALYKWVLEKKE